ncbi:MAG: hypothetical protein E5Y10_22190 [Mesorhizobium sp.]|uniref:phage major capsid protein n=1 Tax=Mesorhizobium sp. TaxID=1871066 RepID=UPI0012167BBD|nr:hypothetical protein [Mesorhizobium sp.]TIN36840.1 MAG: hypothetical protein E5Y13_22800 [Mesorhizobium sp.]TJU86685.1 MAG: hypothetical protein E5Y10_22190 [Mesorhizobium sp.]
MKKASFSVATVAFMVCAGLIAFLIAPDLAHAAGSSITHNDHSWLTSHVLEATLTLAGLRTKLTDLTTRAEQKLAEIKDDTAPDAARAIQSDHEAILAEITETRAAIVTAEAEEAEATRARQEEETRRQAQPPANQADVAAEVARALAAERTRANEIRDICRRAGVADDVAQRHIDEGSTVLAVRDAAWAQMVERSNATRIFGQVQSDRLDETDTRRRGMRDAIVARLARAGGARNVEIPEHARAYGEMGIAEMAAECIGYRGALRTPRQVTDVFERAFHTTSDFPAIFADSMNMRLLARYQVAAPAYRRFAIRYTAADFRKVNVVRAGDFPALQPVNEAGEIKSGTFSESKEEFQVFPYGVSFRLSRQMLINDQLGAIDQVLGSTGDRVADWENAKAFTLLLSGSGAGPTLVTDNKRVFHADHGNLTGSGTAISVASVGVGRASMMKQTTLDGIKANFAPATLLVGPDTLTVAEQLMTTLTPAQQSNAVPESIRRIVPIGDANITGNAWYLFSDPMTAPCFAYGYLDGFEGPRLSSENVFDVQGMKVKLEHDFGFGAIDFRGGYRNAGA